MKYIQLATILLLVACGGKEKAERQKVQALAALDQPPAIRVSENEEVSAASSPQAPENFIFKTANYKFQVENVDRSTKNIEKLVGVRQATVADMNLTSTSAEISNSFVIRIPAKSFELLLDDLNVESIFTDYKRVSTQDVTEEYVDIQTRLKTKKEVRDRIEEILKSKAKTVEDVLKAEEQLGVLQEEIESKEGRLKYLQTRISQSTINLEIYQKVDYKDRPEVYEKPFSTKIKEGLNNGWNLVTTMALFVVNIWPLILLGILIYWRRNWIRKMFTKQ